jgi:tetratricopeptide (TPR) repeat protein
LQARQALRNALHGIRRELGTDVIRSVGDQLVGVDHAQFACDALALETDTFAADTSADRASEPFAGFHVSRAAAFDEWLDSERHHIRAFQARRATPGPQADAVVASAPPDPARARSPHDQDAYALYVRGNYMFLQAGHNGRIEDLDRSRECFERALEIEPRYALAIAGLSNYFAVAGARGVIKPFHEAFGRAIALSHEALAIDASLAVPHVHFGVKALYLDDDLQAAVREFAAAATLDPKYAEGHRFFGITLALIGQRERGLAALETAARLEPDVPIYKSSLAAALMVSGQLVRAEALLREALQNDPTYGAARERLLRLLERQERFGDAVAERLRAPTLPGADRFALAFREEAAAGYRRERTAELRQLVALLESRLIEGGVPTAGDHFHPPAFRLALAYAELGDWKQVRSWRLQACAARPGLAAWFAAEPLLTPLESGAADGSARLPELPPQPD